MFGFRILVGFLLVELYWINNLFEEKLLKLLIELIFNVIFKSLVIGRGGIDVNKWFKEKEIL